MCTVTGKLDLTFDPPTVPKSKARLHFRVRMSGLLWRVTNRVETTLKTISGTVWHFIRLFRHWLTQPAQLNSPSYSCIHVTRKTKSFRVRRINLENDPRLIRERAPG